MESCTINIITAKNKHFNPINYYFWGTFSQSLKYNTDNNQYKAWRITINKLKQYELY